MTREQLAKIEAKKVRSDANLFALFKKYVTEDAGLMYSSGKLPQGCFGCQFNSLFNKWRNLFLTPQKTTKMSNSGKKTYELANKATKIYFKGQVLSNNSSDEAWKEWINYPADVKKVEERKAYFNKLPQEPKSEVKEEAKKPKRQPKKKEETVSNTVENDSDGREQEDR